MSARLRQGLSIAAAFLAALLLRVVPSFHLVFANGIVRFQEGDAWFHIRTVHNLLAHFPWRSAWDPFALFPGGSEVPTAPLWDYVLATPAWIAGLGGPAAWLIDDIAAWAPVILGALFVIPVYSLARRYFGEMAAVFGAFWSACASGSFLWYTHLGLADHHALEGLLAFLTLASLCTAVDEVRPLYAWLGGIALGLFLATRPAGIFLPATLAMFTVVAPAAAPAVLRAVFAAALIFIPASQSLWSNYAWLALAACGAFAGLIALAGVAGDRREWPQPVRRTVPFVGLALILAFSFFLRPALWGSLWFEIRRVAGYTSVSRVASTVQELHSVFRAGIYRTLGAIWIPAIPGLALLLAGKPRTRGRVLLGIWTIVMGIGAVMQVRMAIYLIPPAAVLAGGACAAVLRNVRKPVVLAAMVALICGVNLPPALPEMRHDNAPNSDWQEALRWLGDQTEDPLPGGAWTRYYSSPDRAAAHWGVAVWWDYGYWVEALAHRPPMSNGTQAGAEDMARFFTETTPELAVAWLHDKGARYVIVDPEEPLFAGQNESRFPLQVLIKGGNLSDYVKFLLRRTDDGAQITPVYLPAYYKTMAARLYLGDGAHVTGSGPWIFRTGTIDTQNGVPVPIIESATHFNNDLETVSYLRSHASENLTVGCVDPGVSCFNLDAIHGIRRVFTSDPRPISKGRIVRAVKIFEVTAN
ncbi:MAG TPA: STT3 domain-containing protein [Bryobacteraceae bacterium]|nr:STT3 domain-containing protein [Bryobacteraceae bacterium]